MQTSDKPQFARLLADFMAGYGKPLTDPGTLDIWFKQLEPFPPATIAAAFADYRDDRPDHAPVPNSIASRCRLLDGRPNENEAWAVAITSQDERESVVWTEEMRDAFMLCKPLIEKGDEVAARMAFKDTYSRLVSSARAANRPASWNVSEGWDKDRRQIAVARAASTGLLPAPPSHLMIESNLPPARPEGLKRVLEEICKLEDPLVKAQRLRDEQITADYQAEQEEKRAIAQRVNDYQKG